MAARTGTAGRIEGRRDPEAPPDPGRRRTTADARRLCGTLVAQASFRPGRRAPWPRSSPASTRRSPRSRAASPFWAWLRLGHSTWWLVPGGVSLPLFAYLLNVAPAAVTMVFFGPGVADIETANTVADARQAKPSTPTRSRRTAPRTKNPHGSTTMQAAPPCSSPQAWAAQARGDEARQEAHGEHHPRRLDPRRDDLATVDPDHRPGPRAHPDDARPVAAPRSSPGHRRPRRAHAAAQVIRARSRRRPLPW
jgi:hypothetical protein